MTFTSIRVDTSGFEEAERALRGFTATMLDLRPFWPLLVPIFIRWMRTQFESEGAWGGHKWAPLTPAYAAWKAQHKPGRSILVADGDMKAAASRPSRQVAPHYMILSIVDPKIEYHQDGTPRMVARPVLPEHLPPQADDDISDAANNYVRENLKRFGLG